MKCWKKTSYIAKYLLTHPQLGTRGEVRCLHQLENLDDEYFRDLVCLIFSLASLHFINVVDPLAVIGIQTLHRNQPAIKGLAVDWVGNNIYWLVQDRIMVSRTDGRYLKTLRVDSTMDRNLMLDPERG